MVKFNVDKTPENSFLEELDTVKIDDLEIPLPDNKSKKEKEKLLKSYTKKLKADSLSKNLSLMRSKRDRYKREQALIEKEYLYHRPLRQRIKETLRGSSYLRIAILNNSMDLKFYERPIHDKTATIRKKKYIISKDSVTFINGRPTFFFFEDNPNPIRFNSEEHAPVITSRALYDMFNAKIVNEMFRSMSTGKMIGWTVGMILAVGAVAFFIIAGLGGTISTATQTAPIILMLPIKRLIKCQK